MKVKMYGDKAGAMGKGPGGTATIKSDELQKRFFTMGINDVLCCVMVRKGGLIKRRAREKLKRAGSGLMGDVCRAWGKAQRERTHSLCENRANKGAWPKPDKRRNCAKTGKPTGGVCGQTNRGNASETCRPGAFDV